MLFSCLLFSFTFLAATTVSLESEIHTQCNENGDCMDNDKVKSSNAIKSNNDVNASAATYYEEEDFGNKLNASEIKNLLSTLIEKSDNYDKIEKDVEFVFRGVIVAVILFGVCLIICIISACIYCCRINIIDNRLKSDVEALAEKLQRDCRFKKSIRKSPLPPISESCNIIDADGGIFCV